MGRFVKPLPAGTKLPWYKNNPWLIVIVLAVAAIIITLFVIAPSN